MTPEWFNPFVPNAPFLYPFQGVEKEYVGNEWVNIFLVSFLFVVKHIQYNIQHKISYLYHSFRIRFTKQWALKWIKNVFLQCVSLAHKSARCVLLPHKSVFLKVLTSIYLPKVINGDSRTMCKIRSKLMIKTPEWRHWHRSNIFIANLKLISHILLVFLCLTLMRGCFFGRKSLQICRCLPWK